MIRSIKCCTRCGEEKPLTEFYTDNWAGGGKDSWCKDCVKKYNRQYYVKHSEEMKAYARNYRRTHKEDLKRKRAIHYEKNKVTIRLRNGEWQRKTARLLRSQLLQRFGGKCEKCGFDDPRALQIDHIHGDGAKERKAHNITGVRFYRKLLKLTDSELNRNYQLLCANCQWIKRFENHEYGGI